MCLYPGTVYQPFEPLLFVSIANSYILKCFDGIFVDGKKTGNGSSGVMIISFTPMSNLPTFQAYQDRFTDHCITKKIGQELFKPAMLHG